MIYCSEMKTKIVKVEPNNVSELLTTYKLSPEQLEFYNKHGYIVIKELIDFATLYACKQRFIQICTGKVDRGGITVMKELPLINSGKTGEDLINKIQDILYDDILCTYTENPRLIDVVTQLVRSNNLTGMHSMFINKPPGTSRHPPHQDLHYFPFRPIDRIVAAWTAIDYVHKDNGCLFVVPGSHTGPLLEHGYPPAKDGVVNKMYHGIIDEEKAAPEHARMYVEMSPGDTVFFHPLLIHGSGPNITKGYRKAISCHYAASECHYIDVSGTSQQVIAEEIEGMAKKRGTPVTFVESWQYRSKLVKGVKCNL